MKATPPGGLGFSSKRPNRQRRRAARERHSTRKFRGFVTLGTVLELWLSKLIDRCQSFDEESALQEINGDNQLQTLLTGYYIGEACTGGAFLKHSLLSLHS